jgi:hypothetical protein
MLRIASPEMNTPVAISLLKESTSVSGGFRARSGILAVAILLALPLAAQSPGVPANGVPTIDGQGKQHTAEPSGALDARMEARRIAQLNRIRQKDMVSDAEKLLRLARELNADANSGGAIMSSAERMHKAAEIEKLAKNVKDKMTYAIGAPQDVAGPFAAWQR